LAANKGLLLALTFYLQPRARGNYPCRFWFCEDRPTNSAAGISKDTWKVEALLFFAYRMGERVAAGRVKV
jgi:hypothetical protein